MVLTVWRIRQIGEEFDLNEVYATEPSYFSLKIHHGGWFTDKPGRKYVKGKQNIVDLIDIDTFSVHELHYMMEELGYKRTEAKYYHFLVPELSLDDGLRALGADIDVNLLGKFIQRNKMISVYTELGGTSLETYFCSPKSTNVVIEEIIDDPTVNLPRRIVTNPHVKKKLMLEWKSSVDNNQTSDDPPVQSSAQTSDDPPVQSSAQTVQSNVINDAYNVNLNEVQNNEFSGFEFDHSYYGDILDSDFDPFFSNHLYNDNVDENDEDVHVENEVLGDESDESDYIVDEENNVTEVDVDMRDFTCHVDEDVEFMGTYNESQDFDEDEVNVDALDNSDFESGDESEDEMDGNGNQMEKVRKRKIKELQREGSAKNKGVMKSSFFVTQTFGSSKEVKDQIKKHAIESRRQLKIVKNDKCRVRVVCEGSIPNFENDTTGSSTMGSSVISQVNQETAGKGLGGRGKKGIKYVYNCPWVLLVSKMSNSETWMVKTLKDEHKCLQSRTIKSCTSAFIGGEIAGQVESNPSIPIRAIQEQMQKKLDIGVSKMKAYRAKVHATVQVKGDYQSQYLLLRDYANELKSRNPDTTIKIEVEENRGDEDSRVFKRIYICLGPLKKGFRALGRDLLGLDGAFMKGPYPGILLTAVGLDSNNGIYPVAYAIVEAETYNSWKWFLSCLQEDLELEERSNYTFISDRQKGILPAIAYVFPCAEHRYCVRHIHENMKLQWKGTAFKDFLWKCASATTMPHFNMSMQGLKSFNEAAYNWLVQISPIHWSKSHFTGRAVSDVLLNNMCEVLNRQLVEGRDKPIITALEYTREYLMKRIVNVCKLIDKCEGPLTPTATKIFDKIKVEAASYSVLWNGGSKHQVSGPWGDQCVVDIIQKTCTCRRWEITGIPCKHAVATMWNMALNGQEVGLPESHLHPVYWLTTWKKVYEHKIEPINGRSMWTNSEVPTKILPPKHHTPVGRPRKLRRKAAGEDESLVKDGKLSRRMKTVTCSKCKAIGHNAKGCRGQGSQRGQDGQMGQRGQSGRRGKRVERGEGSGVSPQPTTT